MLKGLKCPRCKTPLKVRARRLGLVRTYPQRCHHCGARLLYDKAGGVYAVEETVTPGGSESSPPRGR